MRPITQCALGLATAVVLTATAALPSAAAPPGAEPGQRPPAGEGSPLTGSRQAAAAQKSAVVTLVTGDRVLVTKDKAGRSAASVLPREDGSQALVQTRQSGDDLYVYPEGAVKALAAGTVDEQLFNVTGLVRQGYDDAHAKQLPLIATYDRQVNAARDLPATPPGAERGPVLGPVDGVALKADKEKAAEFWAAATSPKSRAGGGLKKLWLDRKAEATLDRSTRQVHAPEAWAAGYDGKGTKVAVLDTGADAGHPDLKGRIAAAENFTDSDSTDDRQGHGTHTLSTAGGSGAASGGKKKGVAPGAQLLNGKVLNDSGSGATSWIIAGMEWAVENKADVVSMSLGSQGPTDCDDPMSTAAEELARKSGALFVVAAGNEGPSLNTISSPGCAPSVLTVGAADRDDSTAPFSGRGPARTTHTLKPEITAPGVAISAASAGGRGVYAYQSMSGTSMATPHVAGAAAVLKQRHPDWTPAQLKAALVSAADPRIPGDVHETGGGLLDVKGAVDQQVLGAPAVQGGSFDWPQDEGDSKTVEVPYTNTSDKAVQLRLSVEDVTGHDGSRVRSGVARLGDRTVTVPAGATAKVPLTVHPAARLEPGQYGDVTGRIRATGGGAEVSTPFSLYVQPETVTLTVKLLDRAGKAADGVSSLDVIGTDDATGERRFNEGAAEQTYQLRAGSYFLSGFVATPDAGEGATLVDSLSLLARPQLRLTKDTTVTLDAREAHRLRTVTDRPSEARSTTLAFARSWDEQWLHTGSLSGGRGVRGFYASVEGRASDGDFEYGSYWRTYAPLVSEMKTTDGLALHPVSANTGAMNLDGSGSAGIVDAGKGSPGELEAAGVQGKIAFVLVPDSGAMAALARDAKAAGAKAVIGHHSGSARWLPDSGRGAELPALGLQYDEAARLRAKLAAGPVTLAWKATAKSPYVYNLAFPEAGSPHGDRTYRVRDDRLGKVKSGYHAMGAATGFLDSTAAHRPDGVAVHGAFQQVAVPGERTEFYTAGGGTAWDHWVSSSFPWGEFMLDQRRTYRAGSSRSERWYDGVIAPTAPQDDAGKPQLAAERQGNLIGFAAAMWGDGGHHAQAGSFGDVGNLVLRRNGETVGDSWYPFGAFEVPAAEATYELEQNIEKMGQPAAVWKRSQAVQTRWTFRSKQDENTYSQPLPVIFPRLQLPEDGLKTLPAKDGLRVGLSATGHAGYTPGSLKSAALSYSYDEGRTWTKAPVSGAGTTRTATVDHTGASGKQVWLKVELTDGDGNAVTQTVARAYDVR
ncbi:S8 family serine peptidase [Streptomyces monticola]|uniref:S8 family serine peptidase n=1 Tax=Streptomyces monticola TaxID=2666263 RepID=A0ABW2JBS6_9ACTN